MLAQLGYQVVALTGKDNEVDYLKMLGASEVLNRNAVDLTSTRPLESAQWAGALDSVGGAVLSWLTRTMRQNGVISCFGNAAGAELNATVFPFILRGVRLIGIDSAATAMPLRQKIWHRLSTDLRPGLMEKIAQPVPFSQLPEVFPKILEGKTRGRVVVEIDKSVT
jgi:putative YhdH/YhfP family quinone oxidoreductase